MSTKKTVLEYLQENHTGAENAITGNRLRRTLGMDGTEMRQDISTLRKEEYPICSSKAGYFYAESEEEVRETVAFLEDRAADMTEAKDGLERAMSALSGVREEVDAG